MDPKIRSSILLLTQELQIKPFFDQSIFGQFSSDGNGAKISGVCDRSASLKRFVRSSPIISSKSAKSVESVVPISSVSAGQKGIDLILSRSVFDKKPRWFVSGVSL